MKQKFSKPQKDISIEARNLSVESAELYKRRYAVSEKLLHSPDRKECIVCLTGLEKSEDSFLHRKIPYLVCPCCGHIQTKVKPPAGYPYTDQEISFANVYPELDIKDYNSRVERIYKPKLDWVIESLTDLQIDKHDLFSRKWLDIGAGAGYFLKALQDEGAKNINGTEADNVLVNRANDVLKEIIVNENKYSLSNIIQSCDADVYSAFFVLEHSNEINQFLKTLKNKPKGTIFVFSVPVYGFSCLIESVFKESFARNLDNVIHTQLYTDKSIEYAMNVAGFEITHEWIFGQDAMDLTRCLAEQLSKSYSANISKEILMKIHELQELLQCSLDKLKFSDQRHVIAVKR